VPTLPPDFVYFDIRVAWSEVEKVERVKMLGMPFSGEAARVTVSGSPAMDGTRAFLFFTFSRRRTLKRGPGRAEGEDQVYSALISTPDARGYGEATLLR
jgi:hypothetical protein